MMPTTTMDSGNKSTPKKKYFRNQNVLNDSWINFRGPNDLRARIWYTPGTSYEKFTFDKSFADFLMVDGGVECVIIAKEKYIDLLKKARRKK